MKAGLPYISPLGGWEWQLGEQSDGQDYKATMGSDARPLPDVAVRASEIICHCSIMTECERHLFLVLCRAPSLKLGTLGIIRSSAPKVKGGE